MSDSVSSNGAVENFNRLWAIVCWVLLIALFILWLVGYGPGNAACCASSDSASESTTSGEQASSPNGDSAAQEELVVPSYTFNPSFASTRVFFDLGSASINEEGQDALADVITYVKQNPDQVVVLSGYHDPTGDNARNQELAKQRAVAVKGYLLSQGLSEDRVVLEKPAETLGDGDSFSESRRVEVRPASLD